MTDIFVTDIKLASILVALGVPRRPSDPVTCEIEERHGVRKEQFKFWFGLDNPDHRDTAKEIINAYSKARNWEEFTMDKEHPIYWMKGVLENRECYLGEIRKKVAPIRIIQVGEKTVLIGEHASRELRDKMKKLL
jgi:hypothetical protein